MHRYLPGPRDGVVEAQGKLKIVRQTALAAAVASLFFAPGIHETEAAFTTNFTGVGVTGGTYDKGNSAGFGGGSYDLDMQCNMSYTVVTGINNNACSNGFGGLSGEHDDGTPFFQGLFTDTATSKKYFHVIIGDKRKPGQARNEMVFEYIIEATATSVSFNNEMFSAGYGDASSQANASYNMTHPFDASGTNIKQGNGSGNPTRVIMNQVLYNDCVTCVLDEVGTVNTQFLKGIQGGTVAINQSTGRMTITGGSLVFDSKPIITQFANTTGEMYNQFTIDMRHKNYSDKTQMTDAEANGPNGKITNITNIFGGPADQGDYDTTDATFTPHYTNNSNPNYTAGAYTYTAGAGTNYKLGGGGTYDYDIAATTYVETGFVPWAAAGGLNWMSFCEPTINPDWITNSSNVIGGPKACSEGAAAGRGWRGW